jgi:hypothetical protein
MKTYLYSLHVLEYWQMEYSRYEIGNSVEEIYEKHTIKEIIKISMMLGRTIPDCCGRIYDACFSSGSLTLGEDDIWFV